MGTLPHFGPEFIVAQKVRRCGRRAVGNGIFHLLCHGITGQVGRDIPVRFPQVLCPVVLHNRQPAGAESFFRIDPGNFFDNRVRHGNHPRIAHHAVRLVAHQVPDRKPALFLENLHHRIDEIGPTLRLDDVVQGHGGPIGIPQGEGGVDREAGIGMDGVVGTPVAAVHVAEQRGGDGRMIEGGIENLPDGFVLRTDADAGQFLAPGVLGGLPGGFKVPIGQFGLQRFPGSFRSGGRKGHFQEHLLVFIGSELQAGVADLVGFHLGLAFGEAYIREGFAGAGIKELFLVAGPAARMPPALYGATVHDLDVRVPGMVPAAAMLQVKDQGGFVRGGIGKAVETHTRGGRHFCKNPIALQRDAVVAGLCDFAGAVGIGPESAVGVAFRPPSIPDRTGDGHDGNIEQVSAARSAQMGLAEADHRGIRCVVA